MNKVVTQSLLFTLITCTLYATNESSAEESFTSGSYFGGSVGFEHFFGRRTDIQSALGVDSTLVGSDNQKFSDNAFGFEFFMGYLHILKNYAIALAVEPVLGYKFNKHTVTSSVEGGSPDSLISAEIRRRTNTGVIFRLGYVVEAGLLGAYPFMVYVLAGPVIADYNLRVKLIDEADNSTNKWVPGIRWGGGIDWQLMRMCLGIQLFMENYRHSKLTTVDSLGDLGIIKVKPSVFTCALRLSFPF